jgi:hypothetical protein
MNKLRPGLLKLFKLFPLLYRILSAMGFLLTPRWEYFLSRGVFVGNDEK